MAEPTTTASILVWTTGISSVTMAVLGVDFQSILWGVFGSMFAHGHAENMSRYKAIIYIVLASLIGAAIGTAAQAFVQFAVPSLNTKAGLILGALAGGAGAQKLLDAIIAMLNRKIDSVGGTK